MRVIFESNAQGLLTVEDDSLILKLRFFQDLSEVKNMFSLLDKLKKSFQKKSSNRILQS